MTEPPHPGAPHCRVPYELLAMLFDSVADGVLAVDREQRIIAFNAAAERTLGVERGVVLGRPCREVMGSSLCSTCCGMMCTAEAGEPMVNLPVDLTDSRGRRVPVLLSSSLLHDGEGRTLGAVNTFRDLRQVKDLLRAGEAGHPFAGIVTDDPHMTHVLDIIPTIAASESSVLLRGETGTGKTVLARAVHNLSQRSGHPFVTVNCGALPETLLESELFGYRAGAFTGAKRDHAGRIAAAEGGTLFLDEIGDMSLGMQVKLLRFLQDHVFERLGDTETVRADVRVVAATNRELSALVEEGSFRRDLYYRINVVDVELPPLRERRRDILLLAHHFLENLSRRRGKLLTDFSRAAAEALMKHDYPGNIRELENIVEHAYVLCPGPLVEPEHLPHHFHRGADEPAAAMPRLLADLEGQFILEVVDRHGGNRQAAARDLGMHKTTLLRKARKLGLTLPRQDGRSRRGRKS